MAVYYDKKYNMAGRQWSDSNKEFTTPSNAYFMKFCFGYITGEGDITEYNHDICINVSNSAINGKYYPYVKHTLSIPDAVQALDGYGEGNPDDPTDCNEIIWSNDGSAIYSQKGNIVDNSWVALDSQQITDISNLITPDNLLSIEGGGTLTFENEYGYAVPSLVEYITAESDA